MESHNEMKNEQFSKNSLIIGSMFMKENLTSFFRNPLNKYSPKYILFDMKNGFISYKSSEKDKKFSFSISIEVLFNRNLTALKAELARKVNAQNHILID